MTDKIDNLFNEIGDGRIVKMEVDCSAKVDECIPAAEKLMSNNNLSQALDLLYAVEKESRLAADMRSNSRIQLSIVELCYKSNKYEELFENIVTLTKKRSLIKQAVSHMIQKCCTYVDEMPNHDLKLKLIEVIRTVTEGKIYLEVERARLTFKLAKMLEEDGKLDEAATCLLELQIETFGSMDKHEKVEILLEQMRLCLARKDFIRAQIISRKISTKYFDEKSNKVENMKLRFYQQMITLDQNDSNYLAMCRHFLAISNTDLISGDPVKMQDVLRNIVLYVILAPHSNEQHDLLHRVKLMKNLEPISKYRDLLDLFIKQELISWKLDVVADYEDTLRKGTKGSPPTGVFASDSDTGSKQWENLQTRVGEHNIRMAAKYYSCITLNRLAQLLEWPVNKTESFLCQLIVDGTVQNAKIDRSNGQVTFSPAKTSTEVMNEWAYNVHQIMGKMNKACHLMAKEEMVHKHLLKA